MARFVGGECLPTTPTDQELQAAQEAKEAKAQPKAGACEDCKGRGYLTGLCTCTREGKPTAVTAQCRHCAGRGFVRTTCFTCDGAGTVAGAVEAKQRRDREAQWAGEQDANIRNILSRLQ